MQATTDFYPYKVLFVPDLLSKKLHPLPEEIEQHHIEEDAQKIATALPPNTLSLDRLKTICELVQYLNIKMPIRIKRGKKITTSHDFKKRLLNSIVIIPTSKGKTVFISLHKVLNTAKGAQGFIFKQAVMLKFDASSRLSTSNKAVRKIVAMMSSFEKTDKSTAAKERRISIMQQLELEHSPHFPKNYAFIETHGKNGAKVRIYQEEASMNLEVFHTKIQDLSTLSHNTKVLVFHRLLGAVSDLTACGFTHRDIKMVNVLVYLTDKNELKDVKLSDLGLACSLKDTETLKRIAGSFLFFAPELKVHVLDNTPLPAIGVATDTWALGLIVLSMCREKTTSATRPEKIRTFLDLASAMLQTDPVNRISFEDAQKAVMSL